MASRDFRFLSLRSLQAYQTNGARALPGSVLTVGGIGDAFFSTSISPCTINVSSITAGTATISSISINTITGVSTINASTINTLDLNSRCIDTSSINTSTITVSTLIALPSANGINTLFVDGTNKLFFNGLVVNTGVLSTVSTVYWEPAGNGLSGVITNSNDGNPDPQVNPLRYMVGIGTNFGTDVRSTLNGTLDIQYRGGNADGNALYVSSNGNTLAVRNDWEPSNGQNGININLDDNQTASFGPAFHFNKTRNFTTTQNNDELGYIEFDGMDTNNTLKRAAYIISHQQGAAGNGYVPGTLEFLTTADSGTSGGALRMIIDEFGQVGVNNPIPYKQFQVSTTVSTALDGIACNSADINTIIGSYGQGQFTGDNVGSIQVTNGNNSITPYKLALNPRGGDIYIGSSIASTFINGTTTISSLQVYEINGEIFDPTKDTFWSGYEITPGGTVNIYNDNPNGAVGVGTITNISTNTKFQVNGNTLLQGNFSQFGSTFYFQPNTPSYIDSFKIELDGANCMIYKSTINGNAATFIQNDGDYQLALGTTQPVITINGFSNGNNFVGINNVNPQFNLDVDGSVNTNTFLSTPIMSMSNNQGRIVGLSTINGIQWPPVDDAFWSGSNAGNIYNDNAGNVGIGTNTPASKLEVVGSFQTINNVEIQPFKSSNTNNYIYIDTSGSAARIGGYGGSAIALSLQTAADGNAAGNVGIGTLNPSVRLDVYGSTNITGNLTVTGSAISNVACSTITSITPTWSNYLGKYNFVDGDSVNTLALPGGVTDGTIIVLRNIGLTTSITVSNTFDTAGTNILPGRTSSYVYTTTTPTAGWYGL